MSSRTSHAALAGIVLGGQRIANGMPTFADRLDTQQARWIQAWILKRAAESAARNRRMRRRPLLVGQLAQSRGQEATAALQQERIHLQEQIDTAYSREAPALSFAGPRVPSASRALARIQA